MSYMTRWTGVLDVDARWMDRRMLIRTCDTTAYLTSFVSYAGLCACCNLTPGDLYVMSASAPNHFPRKADVTCEFHIYGYILNKSVYIFHSEERKISSPYHATDQMHGISLLVRMLMLIL